jgi:hypothetical protein
MKKKWALFFFLIISVLSYFWIFKSFQKKEPPEKPIYIKNSYGPYFFPIKISKFTASNLPCISAEIENSSVSVVLDLGFRGQFSFSSEFLKTIKDKKYLRTKKIYSIRGIEYNEKFYKIPKIKVGKIDFFHPILHEMSERFNSDSIFFLKDEKKPSTPEPGMIGWKNFIITNLLLDLKNSKIAFADSIVTLKKQGYATENFIKVPLLLERGLVEFESKTSNGTLRYTLDTGCTWNIINTMSERTKSFQKERKSDNPSDESKKDDLCEIISDNLNTIAFHPWPIKLPILIDAALGMEFFKKYLVFLDFSESYVYFSKYPESD